MPKASPVKRLHRTGSRKPIPSKNVISVCPREESGHPVIIRRPSSHKEFLESIRKNFPIKSEKDSTLVILTNELEICEDQMMEISADAWEIFKDDFVHVFFEERGISKTAPQNPASEFDDDEQDDEKFEEEVETCRRQMRPSQQPRPATPISESESEFPNDFSTDEEAEEKANTTAEVEDSNVKRRTTVRASRSHSIQPFPMEGSSVKPVKTTSSSQPILSSTRSHSSPQKPKHPNTCPPKPAPSPVEAVHEVSGDDIPTSQPRKSTARRQEACKNATPKRVPGREGLNAHGKAVSKGVVKTVPVKRSLNPDQPPAENASQAGSTSASAEKDKTMIYVETERGLLLTIYFFNSIVRTVEGLKTRIAQELAEYDVIMPPREQHLISHKQLYMKDEDLLYLHDVWEGCTLSLKQN